MLIVLFYGFQFIVFLLCEYKVKDKRCFTNQFCCTILSKCDYTQYFILDKMTV